MHLPRQLGPLHDLPDTPRGVRRRARRRHRAGPRAHHARGQPRTPRLRRRHRRHLPRHHLAAGPRLAPHQGPAPAGGRPPQHGLPPPGARLHGRQPRLPEPAASATPASRTPVTPWHRAPTPSATGRARCGRCSRRSTCSTSRTVSSTRNGPPPLREMARGYWQLADRGDLLQPAGGRQPGHRLCGRRPDAGPPPPAGGGGAGPRPRDRPLHRGDPRPPGTRPGRAPPAGARRRLGQQLRPDLPVLPRPGPPGQRRGDLRRGRGGGRPLPRRPPHHRRLRLRRPPLQRTALRLRVGARPALLRPPYRRRPGPLPGRHPLGPARGQAGRRGRRPLRVDAGLADPGHHAAGTAPRPRNRSGTSCARAGSRSPSTRG